MLHLGRYISVESYIYNDPMYIWWNVTYNDEYFYLLKIMRLLCFTHILDITTQNIYGRIWDAMTDVYVYVAASLI